MKPISPHDPLDDLIAAALHGELTPEERAQFDARLQNDPAARAAYQETQLMHNLLEKTHRDAQPDPAFEQRMVSGVRRKIQHDQHRETAWESVLVLWRAVKNFPRRFRLAQVAVVLGVIAVLYGVIFGPITHSVKAAKESAQMQQARQAMLAKEEALASAQAKANADVDASEFAQTEQQNMQKKQSMAMNLPSDTGLNGAASSSLDYLFNHKAQQGSQQEVDNQAASTVASNIPDASDSLTAASATMPTMGETRGKIASVVSNVNSSPLLGGARGGSAFNINAVDKTVGQVTASSTPILNSGKHAAAPSTPAATAAPDVGRKLIRNAELELEVKSYQAAVDQIGALTKAAGGYVDTSNSQRGGNGKLQGTVVVKVLPQNLDDFLLKLRDLGEVQNQSVSTEDVTKAYFDTQARLDNSRRMETQLQELLKHEPSKVADLLQVERELGRVRGEIEQMQGQLKLYDFQVQYATVTMQVREKDLNQAAAYLLREQDNFSLFATNVEDTFQKARQTADDFKAQILVANLNHNSGSDVSAVLVVMVAPDQIEPFLSQVRSLGRVANFTRQTQRVAKDSGDSNQPADQTLTEKDKVQVQLAIRSDNESRKQVALTVVTPAVDDALDKAKAAALANPGVEILSSSLNKASQGQSTAQLSVRIPGKDYHALLDAFRALGRTATFNLQRDDNSGPGANGDDAPVIISLALTDNDTPIQNTEISVLASGVDAQAQQIKKDAAANGVEVKASSFSRQPDGTETAEMTFRLPMSKYPAFVESLKKLGKVESLTVQRDDRPDQTRGDDSAPAEISLHLHNQGDIVADNSGLWATLRQTFGEGVGALFSSVRMIGVMVAFLAPWVFVLALAAWVGRRIYIARKK